MTPALRDVFYYRVIPIKRARGFQMYYNDDNDQEELQTRRKNTTHNRRRVPLETFWTTTARLHVDMPTATTRALYTSYRILGFNLVKKKESRDARRDEEREKKEREREKKEGRNGSFFFWFFSFSVYSPPFFESENVVRGARNTSREIRARHSGTQSIDIRPWNSQKLSSLLVLSLSLSL